MAGESKRGHLWLSALEPVPAGFSLRVKINRRLLALEDPVLMSWLAAHRPFLRWSGLSSAADPTLSSNSAPV